MPGRNPENPKPPQAAEGLKGTVIRRMRRWMRRTAAGAGAMAIFRFEMKLVRRAAGRSIVAAAAYRSGSKLIDQRTGESADYTRRQGVIHTEILAPQGAPKWALDRARLWNAVEAGERRKDAQLAREAILALPCELDATAQIALVRRFARTAFVAKGMVVDIAIHRPIPPADSRNVHAHLLLTLRRPTIKGFGPKVREWNDRELLRAWRRDWASSVNQALAEAGIERQVDHRSRRAQRRSAMKDHEMLPGQSRSKFSVRGRVRRRGSRTAHLHLRRLGRHLRRLTRDFVEETLDLVADVEPPRRER
jgi:ATP-dependent exoDNAse (exonuclease V) alpha subunit